MDPLELKANSGLLVALPVIAALVVYIWQTRVKRDEGTILALTELEKRMNKKFEHLEQKITGQETRLGLQELLVGQNIETMKNLDSTLKDLNKNLSQILVVQAIHGQEIEHMKESRDVVA